MSDGKLTADKTVVVTVEGVSTSTPVELGSDVAPTLSLELGTGARRSPAFVPGVTRDYSAIDHGDGRLHGRRRGS